MSDKQVRNVLADWEMFPCTNGFQVRGKATLNQPSIGVVKGEYLVTSPVRRMYRVDDCLHLETKNSLYILI